jgi:hypothetical protein
MLYVAAFDSAMATSDNVAVFRYLSPSSAKSTTVPDVMNTPTTILGAVFDTAPQSLRISDGPKLWTIDTAVPQILVYSDTLTGVGPTLVSPDDNYRLTANESTGRTDDMIFQWERLSTATHYDLQIGLDSSFVKIVRQQTAWGSTATNPVFVLGPWSATAGNAFNYAPATTYYWRVRASGPVTTPWSEVRSFDSTTLSPWVPEISAPAFGATDVILMPSFVWTPLEGVTDYEFELSDNSEFISAIKTLITQQNVIGMTADLEYGTTYFWRVRGRILEGSKMDRRVVETSDWVVGAFTTIMEPAPEPEPEAPLYTCPQCGLVFLDPEELAEHWAKYHAPIPEPPAPPPTTPAYIWVIIAVGAVLVIALIVLIVRTRRVV